MDALKHSEANEVEVEVEVEVEIKYLRRKIRVAVWDNGIGIDPRVLQSGITEN